MQVIDLFSGIGGFSLAAHWVGWHTVQFCEIDTFCQKILAQNFHGVPIHGDIKTLDYETIVKGWNPNKPTIIVGGYPCQPFSTAGKRKGSKDERHLWPDMLRVIAETKPDWVVAENVPGHIEMGLEQVCLDLESQAYEVWPLVIPASAVGAPHKRDRVWIVAHANGEQPRKPTPAIPGIAWIGSNTEIWATTHAQSRRKQQKRIGKEDAISGLAFNPSLGWTEQWPEVAARLCRVDDGLPQRVDRAKRLKALGNSIVPQIAYQIFKAINSTYSDT